MAHSSRTCHRTCQGLTFFIFNFNLSVATEIFEKKNLFYKTAPAETAAQKFQTYNNDVDLENHFIILVLLALEL